MTWEQLLIPLLAAAGGYLLRHWQAQFGASVTIPPLLPRVDATHPVVAAVGAAVRRELDMFLVQLIRASSPTAPAPGPDCPSGCV